MPDTITTSRRTLLKSLGMGAALIPTLSAVSKFASADAPLLRVDDPQAKAHGYVEDAAKFSAVPAGRHCGNCALYQGTTGSRQGPCSIFPGRQVKAAGWCSAWVPQM